MAELRAETSRPYAPPPSIALEALQSVEVPTKKKAVVPKWIRFAVSNRVFCSSAVFRVVEPGQDEHTLWKFVFGKQQPVLCCMMRLHEIDLPAPLLGEVEHVADGAWDFAFYEDWGSFVFSDDGVFSPGSTCEILADVRYVRGKTLVGDGRFLPFADVAAMFDELPELAAHGEEEEEPKAGTFEDDVYSKHPWLANYLHRGANIKTKDVNSHVLTVVYVTCCGFCSYFEKGHVFVCVPCIALGSPNATSKLLFQVTRVCCCHCFLRIY